MPRRCEIIRVPSGRAFPYEVGDRPILADHVADAWVEDGTARELGPSRGVETAEAPGPPEDAAARTDRPEPRAEDAQQEAEVDATPAAEELAAEHDLDLAEVEGSGKDGRVLKSDVADVVEG